MGVKRVLSFFAKKKKQAILGAKVTSSACGFADQKYLPSFLKERIGK